MSIKSVFWILVLAFLFYVGFKVVPIYYRGIIGIRAVCKEQADLYHKYGRDYVFKSLDEALDRMGIPKEKREHTVTVTENAVVITITYSDTADFFGKYKRDFGFYYECEGELKSVL
ncbi:MAG TPA: hypothetical protein VNK81_01060 [Thermodesulfobacteriota bacterium]|jgi:hypothetical protein|nr:hypothetical protein [Thermodesulfobacteriota bacterium]